MEEPVSLPENFWSYGETTPFFLHPSFLWFCFFQLPLVPSFSDPSFPLLSSLSFSCLSSLLQSQGSDFPLPAHAWGTVQLADHFFVT
jgi:hypothetical protein